MPLVGRKPWAFAALYTGLSLAVEIVLIVAMRLKVPENNALIAPIVLTLPPLLAPQLSGYRRPFTLLIRVAVLTSILTLLPARRAPARRSDLLQLRYVISGRSRGDCSSTPVGPAAHDRQVRDPRRRRPRYVWHGLPGARSRSSRTVAVRPPRRLFWHVRGRRTIPA